MSKPSAKPAEKKLPKKVAKKTAKKITKAGVVEVVATGRNAAVKTTNPAPTSRGGTENERRTQVNRGVTAGGGMKRGDRRDTHPSFSTGKVNRDGGRAGPLGASGRKSGPKSSGNKPAGT
jgi:hypothetical protein